MSRLLTLQLAAVLALVLSGCSTFVNSHRQKEPMMNAYLMGNYGSARSLAQDKISCTANTGDELIWRLEAGSLAFSAGEYRAAFQQLQRAQELIDQNDQKALVSLSSTGQEALAILTNPNVISYVAYDRDRITLPIYKALAALATHGDDAFNAELRQLREIQKIILTQNRKFVQAQEQQIQNVRQQNAAAAQQTANVNMQSVLGAQQNHAFATHYANTIRLANRAYGEILNPLAIFLSGLGNLRTGQFGNARIDFQRLYEALPNNPLAQIYCASIHRLALAAGQTTRELPPQLAQTGIFSFPLDRNCIYVIIAHGRSAALQQFALYWPIQIAVPILQLYTKPFTAFSITADRQTYPAFPIADMDACLAKEYRDRLIGTIIRTITATIAKEVAFQAARHAAYNNTNDRQAALLADALISVGGTIYKVATATADTRTWEAIPKEFLLTQLPMPKDRQLLLNLQGPVPFQSTITIPANVQSAILFVNAPSSPACTIQLIPLRDR